MYDASFSLSKLTSVTNSHGLNQADPEHYLWLLSNLLIFFVIVGGIGLIIYGMKKTQTLKTGAGPWIIGGLLFMIPATFNEILDESEIILNSNFYPDELYNFIFTYSSIFILIGGILLIIGLYRQILIGETLSQNIIKKNLELEAQRLELSDFAHTLSHDLRNELSLIQATLDLMENKDSLESEDIEIIGRRTKQISSLIQRSITLADAGLIIGTKEKINLNNLVREVSEATVPSSIEVKIANLPELSADKEKMYQIVKNLLENAVIHSQPDKIEISAKITDRIIFLMFSNDGTPVQSDLRNKLLKPDISHEEAGRGKGLQIIKKITEAHGWKISLEQSGKTFIIAIPKTFG